MFEKAGSYAHSEEKITQPVPRRQGQHEQRRYEYQRWEKEVSPQFQPGRRSPDGRALIPFSFIETNALPRLWGGRMKGSLIFLFALLLALLLDVKLWLLPLFLATFIFLSNVTHDDYSFRVGLSP